MPRGKRVLPKDITFQGTNRQFKQEKRAELRELKKALNKVQYGCALTPMRRLEVTDDTSMHPRYVYMADVQNIVNAWIKACSVKEWGR